MAGRPRTRLLPRELMKTILLTPDKHQAIKLISITEGKEMTQIVDEAIAAYLATKPQVQMFELVGRVRTKELADN